MFFIRIQIENKNDIDIIIDKIKILQYDFKKIESDDILYNNIIV